MRAQFFSHVSSASSERNADHCTSFQTNNDSKKGIYLNNGGRIDEKLTFAFPIRCFRNTAILPLQTVTRQDDEGNLITT
ncbi:MAG: hypothetical protein K6E76_01935 [Patescibacteria group bacterium]|nr:hypothetical protein [Patescibacteria group bacterium]